MVLNRKHKLDLMIVDYLNLVNVSADRGEVKDTMDLALGEVAGGLKTLSMEQNVACLVLAQLNRNCETRTCLLYTSIRRKTVVRLIYRFR